MREESTLEFRTSMKNKQKMSEKVVSFFHSDYFEKSFLMPEEFGSGCIETIRVRKGLGIMTADHLSAPERLCTRSNVFSNVFVVTFYVSGKRMNAYIQGEKEKLIYEAGHTYVFSPSVVFDLEFSPHQYIHSASIVLVEPSVLYPFVEEFGELLPSEFDRILEGVPCDPYYHRSDINPMMKVILWQIQHCPYHGSLKRLYLEGKTLQLIAHRLSQFVSVLPQRCGPFSMAEIDRLHHAKEILIQSIEDPPCLVELARKVSLNMTKLKTGFREVFGETVFGFVRKQRLERALMLLEEGQRSVTRVAYEVGYNNLSHFSLMFKKRFGICPGSYLKVKRLNQ